MDAFRFGICPYQRLSDNGGKLRNIKFKYTGPHIEAVLDRLPTAQVLEELPEGGQLVEAEVFDGNGLDMWLRSQGEWVKMMI